MIIKKSNSRLKLFLTAIFLFLVLAVISTGCICPLFSLIERLTGFEIKTGKEIDESLVVEELIYPGSMVLAQVEGDMNRIMELIKRYGVSLSEEDLSVLENLPDDIKEQEFGATIYSTADNEMKVLEYYDSLRSKGWEIEELQAKGEAAGSEGQGTILLASRGEDEQAFMLAGTQNNTFIIFIDFDLEVLSELEK